LGQLVLSDCRCDLLLRHGGQVGQGLGLDGTGGTQQPAILQRFANEAAKVIGQPMESTDALR
jgi:hypothetical protein